MALLEKANPFIQQHAFDDVEALWMAQLESDPRDVDDFLATAKAMRKADDRVRSQALLELLAEAQKEAGLWDARLRVLKELGRLSKKPTTLRGDLEEALTRTLGHKKSFKTAMQHAKFADVQSNPVEKTEKVEIWLQYDEGEVFFMAGRGVGVVRELNPDLGVCRLDFEKEKRVSVPLGAAQKFLVSIPEGHLLRRKVSDPDALRSDALATPAEFFANLLQAFGRPLAVGEVKDALIGIVPDEKWGGWWTAARKHPQIVVHGSGAKATYAWSTSTEHAHDSIRKRFEQADLRGKIDLARKHSGRDRELADQFAQSLVVEAERAAKSDPALAWETFATLEKLPGKAEHGFDPDSLLTGPAAARVAVGVSDRQLRERAMKIIRDKNPDWGKVLAEAFFREKDPRVLSVIMSLLEEGGEDAIRTRLVDETLRYPQRHPDAFYWYLKNLNDSGATPDRGYTLLHQMIDAAAEEGFGSLRPRIKEFFDKGALAVRIVMNTDDEEQANKLVTNLERYGQIEEYRRENLRTAALMKYKGLGAPKAEPLYATAEMLVKKRAELEQLIKVDIPENSKALQAARAEGDLRENFEYKARRARAEYLSARAAELQSEISRVRVLEPSQVDTSEVRIGTKVALSNGDVHREVTILGPWESSPEQGVYSHQSDVAKALLGHALGDIVSFMGNDYVIDSINTWA